MNSLIKRASLVCCFLLAAAPASQGQDHNHNHAGATPEKLGKVSFTNSCDSVVQPALERSVALLHSFWWQAGKDSFLKVLEQNPTCAIATWGFATINALLWSLRGRLHAIFAV